MYNCTWISHQLNGHQDTHTKFYNSGGSSGIITDSRRSTEDGFPDADIRRTIETSKGLVPDTDQSGRGATQS